MSYSAYQTPKGSGNRTASAGAGIEPSGPSIQTKENSKMGGHPSLSLAGLEKKQEGRSPVISRGRTKESHESPAKVYDSAMALSPLKASERRSSSVKPTKIAKEEDTRIAPPFNRAKLIDIACQAVRYGNLPLLKAMLGKSEDLDSRSKFEADLVKERSDSMAVILRNNRFFREYQCMQTAGTALSKAEFEKKFTADLLKAYRDYLSRNKDLYTTEDIEREIKFYQAAIQEFLEADKDKLSKFIRLDDSDALPPFRNDRLEARYQQYAKAIGENFAKLVNAHHRNMDKHVYFLPFDEAVVNYEGQRALFETLATELDKLDAQQKAELSVGDRIDTPKKSAPINTLIDAQKNTLLHHAVRVKNQQRMLEFLLELGADPDQVNADGISPLLSAIERDHDNLSYSQLLVQRSKESLPVVESVAKSIRGKVVEPVNKQPSLAQCLAIFERRRELGPILANIEAALESYKDKVQEKCNIYGLRIEDIIARVTIDGDEKGSDKIHLDDLTLFLDNQVVKQGVTGNEQTIAKQRIEFYVKITFYKNKISELLNELASCSEPEHSRSILFYDILKLINFVNRMVDSESADSVIGMKRRVDGTTKQTLEKFNLTAIVRTLTKFVPVIDVEASVLIDSLLGKPQKEESVIDPESPIGKLKNIFDTLKNALSVIEARRFQLRTSSKAWLAVREESSELALARMEVKVLRHANQRGDERYEELSEKFALLMKMVDQLQTQNKNLEEENAKLKRDGVPDERITQLEGHISTLRAEIARLTGENEKFLSKYVKLRETLKKATTATTFSDINESKKEAESTPTVMSRRA